MNTFVFPSVKAGAPGSQMFTVGGFAPLPQMSSENPVPRYVSWAATWLQLAESWFCVWWLFHIFSREFSVTFLRVSKGCLRISRVFQLFSRAFSVIF